MENSNNRPTFSIKELIICSALIVCGCIVFGFMPDEMGILGWVLFAIGTFLNIVGIFRLAAMVPGIENEEVKKIISITVLIAAVFIQFFGLRYLYYSRGTGKAIAITTLTLCTSLGLILYLIDFDDEKMKKKIVIACRIITVFLVAIAIFLNVRDNFARVTIYVGTILLIEAVVTGKIGFARKK